MLKAVSINNVSLRRKDTLKSDQLVKYTMENDKLIITKSDKEVEKDK